MEKIILKFIRNFHPIESTEAAMGVKIKAQLEDSEYLYAVQK
jgi:hypothetical protein